MASPSDASYRTRCSRYYRRALAYVEGGHSDPAEAAALAVESRKLDEVIAYLNGRTPGESLKEWRARAGA